MTRSIVVLCVLATLVATSSAHAQAPPPPQADRSAGVTWATTLPEPGVISVRPRGDHLFVSTVTGLSVYDVRDPRAPVKVGRLELPVAQNEDVDLAGDVLLMSDEPAVGAGRLHVIDISDPTRPTVLSTYDTWARGLVDELLGESPRKRARGGIGHTATCLHDCQWAWLAGSASGIEIVDLRDPRNPRFAGRFRSRETASGIGTHDVQIDASGLAWVAGGGGTAAYDVRDPVKPKLVFRTGKAARGPSLRSVISGRTRSGKGLNDLLHHNSLRLPQGSLGDGSAADPGAPSDVVAITEEDLYRPRCKGAGQFQTWRIGAGGFLRNLDTWRVERDPGARMMCSAHYFDERAGLVAQGWFEQGVRLLDVRDPARIRQVGYWVPAGGVAWGAIFAPNDPTGQTVYGVDHARGVDVLVVDRTRSETVSRRAPARRRLSNTSLFVDDGRDVARPGGKVTVGVYAFSEGRRRRGARVVLQLPEQATSVRVGRRGRLSRPTRTVSFPVRESRDLTRGVVEITLRRDAPPGPLLLEARLVGGGSDVLPMDDRFIDRDVISERRGGRPRGSARIELSGGWLCRVGSAAEARSDGWRAGRPPRDAPVAWLG